MADVKAEASKLRPPQYYAKEVRKRLPTSVFEKKPHRLLWALPHYAVIAACVYLIVVQVPIWLQFVLAIVIGNSLGTIGFLGHEVLHGSVVRGRKKILLLGALFQSHYAMLPTVWISWHNRQHHGHTQQYFKDPDCYGPAVLVKRSKTWRVLQKYVPGAGTKRSYLFLFYWYTFNVVYNILANPKTFRNKKDRKYAILYFVGMNVVWAIAASMAVPFGVVFLMLIPLAISNSIMMSYVATNHSLNPVTNETSDPLVNSLTVRSNRFIEKMHLDTNYHVAHHLFPDLNPGQAHHVEKLLKELWPEIYQEMSHVEALRRVYQTPRFYKKETLLVNPRTGETAPTLLAHYLEMV